MHVIFAYMLDRIIEQDIREALKRSPSVVLTGPRQVGKTTMAISIIAFFKLVFLF